MSGPRRLPRSAQLNDAGVAVAAVVLAGMVAAGGGFFPGPRILAGAGLALAALLITSSGRDLIRLETEEVVLLAVVAWGVLSAALSHASPLRSKEVLAAWLVAWLLWVGARRAGPKVRRLALVTLVGSAALVLLGVLVVYAVIREPRAGGLLENPNVAMALVVPIGLVGVAFLIETGRGRSGAKGGDGRTGPMVVLALPVASVAVASVAVASVAVACVAVACGLAVTGSRAGMLAAIAGCAVLVPAGRWRRRAVVIGGLGALGGLVAVGYRLLRVADPLAWYRGRIWLALLELVRESPLLGVSPGALADAAGSVRLLHPEQHLVRHPYLITHAESTPIGILVQLGVVGLVLVLLAAWLWWSRPTVGGGRGQAWEAAARARCRAFMVAAGVIAVFHDLTVVDPVLWCWALTAGLLDPLPQDPTRSTDGRAALAMPAPGRLVLGSAVAWLVLWGIVQPAVARWWWQSSPPGSEVVARSWRAEPWLADPAVWQVEALLGQPGWSWEQAAQALAWSRRAVRARPGSARHHALLGQALTRIASERYTGTEVVDEARQELARACELEPHLPWYWLDWARLERTAGNLGAATTKARRAVTEEPACVRGWLLLAQLELDQGRLEAAHGAFEAARTAREAGRGTPFGYEQEMITAPAWQWSRLESMLGAAH